MAVAVRAKEFRLTQYHVSDRELLGVLRDALDADGYAESAVVAAAFWPRTMSKADSADARSAVAAVSRRLGYMASQLGFVTREPKKSGLARWTLTEEGEHLLSGRLRAAVERGIDEMDGAQSVTAMGVLAGRIGSARGPFSTAMVRAFRSGYGRR